MGRAAQARKAVRKGRTQRYYDANPDANKRRLKQQKLYNKKGSSKPGTKNITGDEIKRNANRLDRALNGKVGDGLDASHYSKTKGRLRPASENRTEPRLKKGWGRK